MPITRRTLFGAIPVSPGAGGFHVAVSAHIVERLARGHADQRASSSRIDRSARDSEREVLTASAVSLWRVIGSCACVRFRTQHRDQSLCKRVVFYDAASSKRRGI